MMMMSWAIVSFDSSPDAALIEIIIVLGLYYVCSTLLFVYQGAKYSREGEGMTGCFLFLPSSSVSKNAGCSSVGVVHKVRKCCTKIGLDWTGLAYQVSVLIIYPTKGRGGGKCIIPSIIPTMMRLNWGLRGGTYRPTDRPTDRQRQTDRNTIVIIIANMEARERGAHPH